MKMRLKDLTLSLEEDATHKVATEREFVFYAQIEDMNFVKHATSVEDHVQASVSVQAPGSADTAPARLRIRQTKKHNETYWVQTLKIDKTDASGVLVSEEISDPISLESFLGLCQYAGTGMHKKRFVIPMGHPTLKELVWEVDVFILPNGEFSAWCKIDVEVGPGVELSELPDPPGHFTNVIRNQKGSNTPEEGELIRKLYATQFIRVFDASFIDSMR